jgi:hypothetical protein
MAFLASSAVTDGNFNIAFEVEEAVGISEERKSACVRG